MGFWLSCSNRVESLQQQLCARLQESPLRDPFRPEIIIVPGNAMRRWLGLRIATAHGIAANIAFPLPAAWIWQLAARAHSLDPRNVPNEDPLSREQAAWQIFAALPALLPTARIEELNRYLGDDATGVKRWQLAQRIADGALGNLGTLWDECVLEFGLETVAAHDAERRVRQQFRRMLKLVRRHREERFVTHGQEPSPSAGDRQRLGRPP